MSLAPAPDPWVCVGSVRPRRRVDVRFADHESTSRVEPCGANVEDPGWVDRAVDVRVQLAVTTVLLTDLDARRSDRLLVQGYVRHRVSTGVSGDFLFPSPTGAVWTNTNFRARSRWTQATQSADLAGTTIHDLRHTAASLLIAAGADVKAVQVILGHATATMTMDLHGHLFSEAPWLAMERMPTIPMTANRPAIGPAPRDPPAMGV